MKKIALSIDEIKRIEKKEFIRLGNSYKLMKKAGMACAKIISAYSKKKKLCCCLWPWKQWW